LLFNSYLFIGGFLPLMICGYALLTRYGKFDVGWLVLGSIFFYGWWDWRFVPLLLLSITFNFCAALLIIRSEKPDRSWRLDRASLGFAIVANLALLGYFKYVNFFLANMSLIQGRHYQPFAVLLPLGISFFTFTQIAYLVDAYKGEAREYNFLNYMLFVSYFPHLIAGPILHHKQIMPQIANRSTRQVTSETLALGLTIFIIGLFKKVALADGLAPAVDRVFSHPDVTITMVEAWGATLAYALQLYFDFSGYSDMAIGISRMFGINLPINFNSPYKSQNIIEFWRRWHVTLSRFLRDYVYIPLGGNRRGKLRRYINLFLTMLIGGLWHGAGWTFVAWGALHGLYLMLNHAWHWVRGRYAISSPFGKSLNMLFAWGLTFFAVNLAWVFFRAESFGSALEIIKGMVGLNGILPVRWIAATTGGASTVQTAPLLDIVDPNVVQIGKGPLALVLAALAIALFMPNTQQITGYWRLICAGDAKETMLSNLVRWRPAMTWAVFYGAMGAACIYMLGNSSKFLYFQF
jgi:alginate O-acetyltransferase complex protein AlgI